LSEAIQRAHWLKPSRRFLSIHTRHSCAAFSTRPLVVSHRGKSQIVKVITAYRDFGIIGFWYNENLVAKIFSILFR